MTQTCDALKTLSLDFDLKRNFTFIFRGDFHLKLIKSTRSKSVQIIYGAFVKFLFSNSAATSLKLSGESEDLNKEWCVLPMFIWSEFRMWQYRDDDYQEDAPYFNRYERECMIFYLHIVVFSFLQCSTASAKVIFLSASKGFDVSLQNT